jgi:leucyl aminopeptidase (aminopeptidase T)
MDIVKGSSVKVVGTVYSDWTGTVATSTVADLTGGTIKMFVKLRATDLDADALLTISGTVTNGPLGLCEVVVPASSTNTITYNDLFYEVVAKLAIGTYYRTGVLYFNLKPNVAKVLF